MCAAVNGSRNLRIGIDVGGTNTDAVVMDANDRLVASTKSKTTSAVSEGIAAAVNEVLLQLGERACEVGRVMLGTTHGINAVLERRNLCRVAVIRLGAPATASVPPLVSWPSDLREAVVAGVAILPGGNYVEGRSIQDVDAQAVRDFLDKCEQIDSVAVTGVFSPAYRDHELQVADIVREHLGAEVNLSLSHEVGSLGLLPRENATVLNAALYGVASDVTSSLRQILDGKGLDAETFFAQNDGTLMGVDLASRFPVLTIGSGPANSIRGAAFLTGLTDAIVADVGGTSTDFGVLVDSFPRESAMGVDLAGVKTNFRMPDVLSIGVGGGTVVTQGADGARVGPESVGYRLRTDALCFGGSTMTLTDAAVAAGRSSIGTVTPPAASLATLDAAMTIADGYFADAIESMNLGRELATLVVVGGGGFLLDADQDAVSRVVRPDSGEVANAVGVAIAPVGGRWDTVVPSGRDRRRAIDEACEIASSRAVQAGADPSHVEIIEITEIPVGYLPEPATRLKVRAAGPLGWLS